MEKPPMRRKQREIVIALPKLVFLCLLSCPIRKTLDTPCGAQTTPRRTHKLIRFRISDSESGCVLPDVLTHIVYRSDKKTQLARQELDVMTEKNFAKIPKLKAEKASCQGRRKRVISSSGRGCGPTSSKS
jgi:hypothetical protein